MARRKYEGAGYDHEQFQGRPFKTHSYTEFAAAGQDAFSLVPFVRVIYGRMETQSSELTDFGISCANILNTNC